MKNVVVQFSSKLDGPFLIVMFRIFEFRRLGMLSRVCWLVKQLCSAKQLHTLEYLLKDRSVVEVESEDMFSNIESFFIYSDFRAHPYHSHIFPFPINWKFKESRRSWEEGRGTKDWDVFSKAGWSDSSDKVSLVRERWVVDCRCGAESWSGEVMSGLVRVMFWWLVAAVRPLLAGRPGLGS